MQLNLGTKIRALRQRDGRTQDALAEALGITAQAVSRWESGGSYPDIEMIPAIANYFHISIDELFGYHDDREKTIKDILDAATNVLSRQGFIMTRGSLPDDVGECVKMLRVAAEEFPNEPKILLKLAQALQMWGWNKYGAKGHITGPEGLIEEDVEYNAQNVYWQEALRVYEKILRSEPTPEIRVAAIRQIIPLYCKMGEYERAKVLACQQNPLAICKEILLPLATAGQEKARYLSEQILALLYALRFALSESNALHPNLSTESRRQVLESQIHLYETIFSDGRCGVCHMDLAQLYLELFDCMNDDRINDDRINDTSRLICFDRAFEHYKAYERIRNAAEYHYSAPLVRDLPPLDVSGLPPVEKDFWKKRFKIHPSPIIETVRSHSKYAECFE
ncbi:MAG: helix-turn-helix transcriptional regulator [Clostridia bacterium]|nr:helix-turn-helix transcriptional regulator [Clostridia bacterium]